MSNIHLTAEFCYVDGKDAVYADKDSRPFRRISLETSAMAREVARLTNLSLFNQRAAAGLAFRFPIKERLRRRLLYACLETNKHLSGEHWEVMDAPGGVYCVLLPD